MQKPSTWLKSTTAAGLRGPSVGRKAESFGEVRGKIEPQGDTIAAEGGSASGVNQTSY